jgi:hypothetical protein
MVVRMQPMTATEFGANTTATESGAQSSSTEDHIRVLFALGAFQFSHERAKHFFRMAMDNKKVNGRVAEHSPELQRLLIKLASNRVTILRTFGPDHNPKNPHGRWVGHKLICSAIDVAWYAGSQFLYTVGKERLINGVVRLLTDLPDGASYDAGFVRPVGDMHGYAGFPGAYNPSLELFFPVPPKRVPAAYHPDGTWGWGTMFPEVRQVVQPAAGAKVKYIFPDGPDHMHLRAY